MEKKKSSLQLRLIEAFLKKYCPDRLNKFLIDNRFSLCVGGSLEESSFDVWRNEGFFVYFRCGFWRTFRRIWKILDGAARVFNLFLSILSEFVVWLASMRLLTRILKQFSAPRYLSSKLRHFGSWPLALEQPLAKSFVKKYLIHLPISSFSIFKHPKIHQTLPQP